MIVCIPSLANSPSTGKAFFCERLASALSSLDDVRVISDIRQRHDVSLHVVLIEGMEAKAKRVVRLDGVWHNTAQDFGAQNDAIRYHMNNADAVIYQTQFSRLVADKYLFPYEGLWDVIFNGADPSFYAVPPLQKTHRHTFIAYSRWRPHKRLLETITCFLEAGIEDSCLYVAGDLSKCGVQPEQLKRIFDMPNIRYLGILTQEQLAHTLRICDASLHLSWIDWCPNSVVEAIAAGLPVVTNNVGGAQELVRPSGGFVCRIDEPWDMRPCNLYSPPPIDPTIVAEALHRCAGDSIKVSWEHVEIRNIALQYKRFFERVLDANRWV